MWGPDRGLQVHTPPHPPPTSPKDDRLLCVRARCVSVHMCLFGVGGVFTASRYQKTYSHIKLKGQPYVRSVFTL